MKTGLLSRLIASLLLVLLLTETATAQFDFSKIENLGGAGEDFGGEQVSISAQFVMSPGSQQGQLQVTAIIEPAWHIYSVTQAKGGPLPTVIELQENPQYRLAGPFVADQQPKIKHDDLYKGIPLEEHYDIVTWKAPILLAENVKPAELELPLTIDTQVCKEGVCKPLTLRATAQYAGDQAGLPPVPDPLPPEAAESADQFVSATPDKPFSHQDWNIHFHGSLRPGTVSAGEIARLHFTAVPQGDYHIYAWEPQVAKMIKVTQLAVALPEGWAMTDPVPSQQAHFEPSKLEGLPDLLYHEDSVTWTIEIHVPAEAEAGTYEIEGAAAFHTCTDSQCDAPAGLQFRVPLIVGPADSEAAVDVAFAFLPEDSETSPYAVAAERVAAMRAGTPIVAAQISPKLAADTTLNLDALKVDDGEVQYTFWGVIGLALLGGLALNVMPCVLPVIGLKVMSFVQQAGESRTKIFALNMWYVLGMMSIFLTLATLAVFFNLGWGEHFSDSNFQIVMAAVVFAMALSFLGVWEIPLPGFVGSGKAAEAAEKEGPFGAIFKGMLTTVLATPCSGPGLATALVWCTGKPPTQVYLVFTALGLGMSLPYILIGIFPKLINFLPKPGAWMDTFKQVMGFVLLATVVFFLTFMAWELIVPTVAFLFGIWAAAWWVGRTPIYAETHQKLRAWSIGSAFAALIGIVAFTWLADYSRAELDKMVMRKVDEQLAAQMNPTPDVIAIGEKPISDTPHDGAIDWEGYSVERLSQLAKEEQTVMVDFTAQWCFTCKYLEASVINTEEVREALRQNNVATLVADWSDRGPEIGKMLESLGGKQVPVVAIFPAGRPNEPIVLRGMYDQATLLERLRQAGPSKSSDKPEKVASRPEPVQGA